MGLIKLNRTGFAGGKPRCFAHANMQKRVSFLTVARYFRPSEDDVSELKRNLVHVQKTMDQLNQDREREAGQWQDRCSQLGREVSEKEEIIRALQEQLEKNSDHEKNVE